jgi:hypothetical protein
MSEPVPYRLSGAWVVLLGLLATHAVAAGVDGRAALDAVYAQDRGRTRVLHATLEVFDRNGHGKITRFVEYRSNAGDGRRTLLVFKDPAAIRGLELLSIEGHGAGRQQWVMPVATHRARAVSEPDRAERFAGSDFSYEDLGDPALDDFGYRLVQDVHALGGHPAWLVVAVPLAAGRSQYAELRYWVARDIPCVLYAEMRDAAGRLVRTLRTGGYAQRAGIWGPRRIEARSVADGTRSVLSIDDVRFDAALPAPMFTPEGMEAGTGRSGAY